MSFQRMAAACLVAGAALSSTGCYSRSINQQRANYHHWRADRQYDKGHPEKAEGHEAKADEALKDKQNSFIP